MEVDCFRRLAGARVGGGDERLEVGVNIRPVPFDAEVE
jgi:hypothetical protein